MQPLPLLAGAALAFAPGLLVGQIAPSRAATAPRVAPAGCARPARWSLAHLAANSLVVPAEVATPGAVAPEVAAGAGGVILLGVEAPRALAHDLATLAGDAPDGLAPFVMVDEEGGAVQRLENLVGPLPSARQLGKTKSASEIEGFAERLGVKLRALGVTMDLAPVLDVDGRPGPSATDADGTRSFSANPAIAAADGIAFAEGLRAAGVVPVVKHFPGLGDASGNTDLEIASTLPLASLLHGGLEPFVAAIRAGLPAVMVSNAAIPGLTHEPASLATAAISGELRTTLGFRGLVLTDSLSAVSVSGRGDDLERASVQALRAGADLVLFNASASATASVTARIEASIEHAVHAGSLTRRRLVGAADEVLAAHGLTICPAS